MHGGWVSRAKTRVGGCTSATAVAAAATAAAAEASARWPAATAAPHFITHRVCPLSPPPTRLRVRILCAAPHSKSVRVAETR